MPETRRSGEDELEPIGGVRIHVRDATEEAALADTEAIVDELTAWRLARRAGVKFFAACTVAPYLTQLATGIFATVAERARVLAKWEVWRRESGPNPNTQLSLQMLTLCQPSPLCLFPNPYLAFASTLV